MDRHVDALLRVRNLGAGYGGTRIVTDIDLVLYSGDVLGLLGANGAGKSTFLKALTGQIRLLSGTVAINGVDLQSAPVEAKAQLGLAIDASDLPAALSGRQYLEFVASVRNCAATDWPAANLLERLGLMPWLDRAIAEYSLGTRAKISIAAALLGSPPLLIFDESLNGLDPVSAWECKRLIQDLATHGHHSIILSTHIVETVPALCNRAIFLADGRVVRSWNRRELAEDSHSPGAFEDCVMQALRTHRSQSA